MKKRLLACGLVVSLGCLANTSMSVDLTPEEHLGKAMYEDVDFSFNQAQSCKSCHDPVAGFADPTNAADPFNTAVSTGADGVSKGARNAPTAAYAGFSPVRYKTKGTGEYFGGLFWDSRADGSQLGDPLAEQAQGPPLNPVEMAMPTKESIVAIIADKYADSFADIYGFTAFDQTDEAYNLFARAIAAYERSPKVLQFASRFDLNSLTPVEQYGQSLFKAHCNSCHFMGRSRGQGPLFTSFGYANIGIPENPLVVGDENDLGLGKVVGEQAQEGKFKIPTLRNVEKTAPYGHNGYFPTLKDVVNFKNSRDSMGLVPDVPDNISNAIGNLGMTEAQVDAVVQFLLTLSDPDPEDTLAQQTAAQGE